MVYIAMSRKTPAVVAQGPNKPPTIEEIELEEPRSDEAIVEIHAVGVCHADLAVLHGKIPTPFPIVLGHEGTSVLSSAFALINVLTTYDVQELASSAKLAAISLTSNQATRSFSVSIAVVNASTVARSSLGTVKMGSLAHGAAFARISRLL
jgi:hypothetical protein